MDPEMRHRADARFESALAASAWADPRTDYRDWLKALKQRDASRFEEAVRHYEETVLARMADPESDPVQVWFDYGRHIAGLAGEGRYFAIDGRGRARRLEGNAAPPADCLVVFLTETGMARGGLALATPREPTSAQQATVDLLVNGQTRMSEPPA